MSIPRHHSDWLSLIEVSGPFLSVPVLMRAFPQGLHAHDPEKFRRLKVAYEEWEENNEARKKTNPAVHVAWIKFVLSNTLGLPADVILEQQAIPPSLQCSVPEHGEFLRPSIVIANPPAHSDANKPRLLVQVYPANQDLSKSVHGKTWKASPGTRMMDLLHASGVRLGLVTNGEQWMLVDAPKNETTGFASWYANGWIDYGEDDHAYLRSFTSLLGVERFFNAADTDTLEVMLHESASNQQEVTEQLGYQVRRATEVLIESLDKADQNHGRELLQKIPETEIYEAALTVMMRLVFLFSAEERGLLLLNDELYARNYALSTMREQLRKTADDHGEELLERRYDAWCRLLSTFRAVFGGVKHDRLNLPAYGGRLFDPDRFPFLEGRKRSTSWKNCEADPLPVDNRTVLHLLDALQLLRINGEARRLSFRALDIEQIGHVYEGMLDHTAKRAKEPMLGLVGTRKKEPEIPLAQLEELKVKGNDNLIEFLKVQTGKSANALKKAIGVEIDLKSANRFQAICGNDVQLLKRIAPFAGIIREDSFGEPVIIPVGSIFVTAGTDRRSSGTHYTPRSLTEPIVQYTLEPLIYIGPAEGRPKEEWQLRTPRELLELKICDMACGSGAFLVQACRYLSERLVEAWEAAEKNHPSPNPGKLPFPTIMAEGKPSTGAPGESLIPKDVEERMAFAKRLIAQRCLYGVDINPLATEMAKLSLWLLTLAKDKPFTFLDHAIRCGDSLLGLHDLKQLKTFSLDGTGQQYVLGEMPFDKLVDEAVELRLNIESMPGNTIEEVEAQSHIMADCEQRVEFLKSSADLLIAAELQGGTPREKVGNRDHAAVRIGHYLKDGKASEFKAAATRELGRRSFHWPLEFPEVVVKRGGFDAFVGNPPFLWALRISIRISIPFSHYLKSAWPHARKNADLCSYFLLRAFQGLRPHGTFGFITTNTIAEADTRETSLNYLTENGGAIFRANPSIVWPGSANVRVASVHIAKCDWKGSYTLSDKSVTAISTLLEQTIFSSDPDRLMGNGKKCFKGSVPLGDGFFLSAEEVSSLIHNDAIYRKVLFPYLTGDELNSSPELKPGRWVIYFRDWTLEKCEQYPRCLDLVRQRVKPERDKIVPTNGMARQRRDLWWKFTGPTVDLYEAIVGFDRVIVASAVSKHHAFAFVPATYVYSNALNVFAFSDDGHFCLLQSSLHAAWALHQGSKLEDRPRYNVTDCFETFPFPENVASIVSVGSTYNAQRSSILQARNEGMTRIYNLVNDSNETSKDIQKLRQLHIDMDNAVATAYGWTELDLGHDFHETTQGIRFTISETARREVLARLLKLNHERCAEELAEGSLKPTQKRSGTSKKLKPTKHQDESVPATLFDTTVTSLFPATNRDKLLCGFLCDLIAARSGLPSIAYLDSMVLALRYKRHSRLLIGDERKQFISLCKSMLAPLANEVDSLPWNDLIDVLTQRSAIQKDVQGNLKRGDQFDEVRRDYPACDAKLIRLIHAAAATLWELQSLGKVDAADDRKELAEFKEDKQSLYGVQS